MDKLDIILDQLKEMKSGQERIESDIKALRNDNKEIHTKLDTLEPMSKKIDMTWQAVQEMITR